MPGESLGNHASPILLLILKMSVLRKAIFLTLEDSLSFALIADSRSKVLHDAVPFCKVVCSWFSGITISHCFSFVIQLVVKTGSFCKKMFNLFDL